MKSDVTFSNRALRQLVEEVFDNAVPRVDEVPPMQPIDPNSMVDPTTAIDDPAAQGYVPHGRAEFSVALNRATEDVPEEQLPGLYKQIQAALAAISGLEAGDPMKKTNTVAEGASTNYARAEQRRGDTQAEAAVRQAVRKMINGRVGSRLVEARPGLSYSGPDTYATSSFDDEPWKVYELLPSGRRRRQSDASFESEEEAERYADKQRKLAQRAGREVTYEVVDERPAADGDDGDSKERGEWSVPKGDLGLDFKDIARELGVSQMGAQGIAARALKRYGHMRQMMFGDEDEAGAEPERAEVLMLTAAKEFIQALDDPKVQALLSGADMQKLLPDSLEQYRDFLEGSGELEAADVQLLRDHPTLVAGLDGYADYVRTELTGDMQAELADLPNDLEKLMSLDAFREFLSKHIKRSMRDSGAGDED
jgi:hypothetical protein